MTDTELFPRYIRRPEEHLIIEEARRVRDDGSSRSVLLYGAGGTGKTRLVRQLPQAAGRGPDSLRQGIIWLEPIDVDDSQHWLLSNLERNVVRQLDPDNEHFGEYISYLSELPRYAGHRVTSHETVLSHLARVKGVFERCYRKFIVSTGATVVVTFDTVEAIRGMYALFTLTQWIKALPGSLFILAGRTPSIGEGSRDSIKTELEDPHRRMPVTEVRLAEFSYAAAREYFENSGVAADLSDQEKEKLVCLTRAHPLWLAFTLDYLAKVGIPAEVAAPLDYIRQNLPLGADATVAGRILAERFRRRLITPYRESDFWHEAIRRLAVVRESVSQPVWCQLMADVPWPSEAPDPDSAWEMLRRIEWVRPRANSRYVTLHDAVAEELAQRVIRLHDQDGQWRKELWQKAAGIYADLARQIEDQVADQQASVADRLRKFDDWRWERPQEHAAVEEAALIRDVTAVDAQRQETSRLRSAQVFYRLLSGFADGTEQFLALLAQARDQHNVLFEDLLAFQMQRFLPARQDAGPPSDALAATVRQFQDWLLDEGTVQYADIGLAMAEFLIDKEQLVAALALLDRLPVSPSDHYRSYRLSNLRGNAHMRTAGQVRKAETDFTKALAVVLNSKAPGQLKLVAQGYKGLGFYYRNIGLWEQADEAYSAARDAISPILSAQSPDSDREEMASIQTNWAYLKGIGGSYRDGINLVQSAISLRRRLGRQHEVAMSLSVSGEVYRYQRSFPQAWTAYAEAEQIFREFDSWSWLGQIHQQQAICLFQAQQDGVSLVSDQNPVELAEALILRSLNLCHELNARAYPSALNRAGRIFGDRTIDVGLDYLMQAADAARGLSDGWFWFASLVEYAELSYRAWTTTTELRYLEQISSAAADLEHVMEEYGFPELRGRWYVLLGHMSIQKALGSQDEHDLMTAFENYRLGFPLITRGYVGSYGRSAIPDEFKRFADFIWKLRPDIRAQWQQQLRSAWSQEGMSATILLARLEELY